MGKRDSSNKASWIQKKMGFRIIPRIIPESYLKLPTSEPWYICKIRTYVLWALFFATIRHGLHYASCCFWEKSDNSTLQRAAAPFTSTLAARVGYSTYSPCSTLKHHPLQQHQQASSTTPSSSTFHPHPLTSMPAPKQGLQHTPLWRYISPDVEDASDSESSAGWWS